MWSYSKLWKEIYYSKINFENSLISHVRHSNEIINTNVLLLISNEKYTHKSSWLIFFLIKKNSRIINYDNENPDERE